MLDENQDSAENNNWSRLEPSVRAAAPDKIQTFSTSTLIGEYKIEGAFSRRALALSTKSEATAIMITRVARPSRAPSRL